MVLYENHSVLITTSVLSLEGLKVGSLEDGNRNLIFGYGSPRDQTAHLATSSCAMQILFDILMFIGCLENQNGTINLPYHLGIHDNFHGSKSLTLAGTAPQNHIVRKTTIFAVQCLFGQSIPRWLVANQPQSEYLSW